MGPNHAQLVRVYTRTPGGAIADETLAAGQDFEIVAEAEAGFAVFGSGASYRMDIVVRDVTAGTAIPHTVGPASATTTAAAPLTGQLGDTRWPAQAEKAVFTVRTADLTGRDGHLGQVFAYLLIGNQNPDASTAVSPLFLIEP